MLTQERYAVILQALGERGAVTVGELTELLRCSESTVRRDLAAMADEGLLNKVHGGATALENDCLRREFGVEIKYGLHAEEKRKIGRAASLLVHPGDFVFLDAGTTTESMVDTLDCREAVYVTNGIQLARRLAARGLTVLTPAGRVKSVTDAIVGSRAVESFSAYHFTIGFFGVNGVSLTGGYSTPDEEEAQVKKAAMARCRRRVILADPSKFGGVSAVTFGALPDAEILTTSLPDPQYAAETTVMEVDKP